MTIVEPAKIEEISITIEHNFENRFVLPPISVWSRVIDKGSFLTAVLSVRVKRKAFLFDRRTASGFFTCILSRQGHLVVYVCTEAKYADGFAYNLRKASKLHIKCKKQKALVPPGEPPKRICTVTAEWRSGSVVLKIQDRKMAEWCCAIVEAIALDQGFPPASRFDQSLGTGLMHVPKGDPKQPTPIPTDAAHQELGKVHQTGQETTKKKNAEKAVITNSKQQEEASKQRKAEEQKTPVDTALLKNTNAGPAAPTSLSDPPASIVSDSEAEDVKEDGLADPIGAGVNSAEEEHKFDGSDFGDEPSHDQQEAEEAKDRQKQKEEGKTKKVHPPPTPLKRRVTFSNLNNVVNKENRSAEVQQLKKKSTEEEKPIANSTNGTSGGPSIAVAQLKGCFDEWMKEKDGNMDPGESNSELEPAWESFEEKTPEYRATTSAGLAKYQRHPRTPSFAPAAETTTSEQHSSLPNPRGAPFDYRCIDDDYSEDDEW